MEENQKKKIDDIANITKGIIWIIFIIFLIFAFKSCNSSDENTSNNSTNTVNSEPTDAELMAYAQTVLEKYVYNVKYSRNTADYTFVKTNLRYKIEGNVTTENGYEKFYLIIEFTDKTYTAYDTISLQVGDKKY